MYYCLLEGNRGILSCKDVGGLLLSLICHQSLFACLGEEGSLIEGYELRIELVLGDWSPFFFFFFPQWKEIPQWVLSRSSVNFRLFKRQKLGFELCWLDLTVQLTSLSCLFHSVVLCLPLMLQLQLLLLWSSSVQNSVLWWFCLPFWP